MPYKSGVVWSVSPTEPPLAFRDPARTKIVLANPFGNAATEVERFQPCLFDIGECPCRRTAAQAALTGAAAQGRSRLLGEAQTLGVSLFQRVLTTRFLGFRMSIMFAVSICCTDSFFVAKRLLFCLSKAS